VQLVGFGLAKTLAGSGSSSVAFIDLRAMPELQPLTQTSLTQTSLNVMVEHFTVDLTLPRQAYLFS